MHRLKVFDSLYMTKLTLEQMLYSNVTTQCATVNVPQGMEDKRHIFLLFTFDEMKELGSPRSLENVAPPRVFPRGSANPKARFAFLSLQISSLRPWQVQQRRNVLTRSDAQQSLGEGERERQSKYSHLR